MAEPRLPAELIEARRTPLFDAESVPAPLTRSHRTSVWAELRVQAGTVRYLDLEGPSPRDVRLGPGQTAVIPPGVEHHVEPSTDARFFVQFYRTPDAGLVPEPPPDRATVESARRAGRWQHRGCDLDSPEEIVELVTRQYADVVQDELLAPHFAFGPGFIDWQAHIGNVADYWNHVVLLAPDYEIDVLDSHHRLHEGHPFTPELFDRWLEIFHDTVAGGWTGPLADTAKKRATGMAWAMAQRLLGKGTWQPAARH
jgi:hemoglobin